MADGPTFADWAKLAARELKDTPVESLNRDYGGLTIKPAYFPDDATDPAVPGAEPFWRSLGKVVHDERETTGGVSNVVHFEIPMGR